MEENFEKYLLDLNLSHNTIISYLCAIRQFEKRYVKFSKQNLRDYKIYLIEHYKPQTVNLRMDAVQRNSGFLFLNKYGELITARGIAVQLKHFAMRYGLDPAVIYPHSFRHRFAKSFLERYNDIAMLADLMGHSSIEITRIYLRKTSTEQQSIINQVIDW